MVLSIRKIFRTVAKGALGRLMKSFVAPGFACESPTALLALAFMSFPCVTQAHEPEASVMRFGREGLVRCAFSADEDMVFEVKDLANEWVYLVPRSLPTVDFSKGDLVHAGPDDYCAIHLGDFGFMSGNHGSYFVHCQMVRGHGFGPEAVGSCVLHETGEALVIVGVPDGDHLWLHPEGTSGANPCFKYLPSGRFTCGERAWTPSATVREQLWPMSRYRRFRWLLADGSEAPHGREAKSRHVDLVLEHDVLDPRGVVQYLKHHPGQTGRRFGIVKEFALADTGLDSLDAEFMAIPALMTIRTIYRYDGRCCRQVFRQSTFNAPIREASVMDVCYCWDQGEAKWEDVEFYIPRLKPVTLKGYDGGCDVICDFTGIEKMPYPPWKVNTNIMRCDATSPDNPPDRFVRRLKRGKRQLGVALGYSLVNGVSALGKGWPDRNKLYHFWPTGKMYPHMMSLRDIKGARTYSHSAYTQFFDPTYESDATDFYCHREGDELIVYMDFHKTLVGKRIALPHEANGRRFKVVERTPSVRLHAMETIRDDSIVIDVDGGYGTLVLRIHL